MNYRRGLIIVTALMIALSAVSFAKENIDAVSVKEFNATYKAPKAVELQKPERVFYSKDREVEGYVTLEITVDAEGKVESARVLYKTSQLAVKNAVNAVSEWAFKPATLNDMPVRSTVAYSLPFGRDLEILQDKDYQPKVIVDDTTVALLQR